LDEMLRLVREQELPKPSARLSSSAHKAKIAETRRMEPAKLGALIRGDLDWIAMKCLEKDRARRYDTANALAQDIQRHLADDPVLASPPSATYRLGKFLKKRRGLAVAVAAVFVALLAGVAATSWGLVRALDAEARAVQDRDAKGKALEAEAKARQEAEARAV